MNLLHALQSLNRERTRLSKLRLFPVSPESQRHKDNAIEYLEAGIAYREQKIASLTPLNYSVTFAKPSGECSDEMLSRAISEMQAAINAGITPIADLFSDARVGDVGSRETDGKD